MKFFWIAVLCIIVLCIFCALIYRSQKAKRARIIVSEDKFGQIIAALAFVRFQKDIEKDVQRLSDIPFMLPEKIHYYNDLMYVCTMIHLLNDLPQSVDLDNVATSAIIHLQSNHISCLTYLVVHNDSEDAASQVVSDYEDMFDIVGDALQTKSPFILGGAYRDHVIRDSDIFNQLNEGLKITQMVTSWLSDAAMLLEKYEIV